jgi:hypothetical protein
MPPPEPCEISLGTADTEPVKQPIGMRQALRAVPVRPVRIGRRIIGDGGIGRLGRDPSAWRRLNPGLVHGCMELWRRGQPAAGWAVGVGRSGLGVQPVPEDPRAEVGTVIDSKGGSQRYRAGPLNWKSQPACNVTCRLLISSCSRTNRPIYSKSMP